MQVTINVTINLTYVRRSATMITDQTDFIHQLTGLLEAIIQEGIESGEFASTDARRAARALDALLSGTLLHWVYAPEEVDVEAQLRYGVRLIFRGCVR